MEGELELAVPFEVCDYSQQQIPFDLFVSKKKQLGLTFTDSAGNLAYRVHKLSQTTNHHHHHHHYRPKLILDSSDNTLFSLQRISKESWQGFKGIGKDDKDLIFKADRISDGFTTTQFKILLVGLGGENTQELTMRGCPFKRACTIYRTDSIVAESGLMYKLGVGKMFVPRNRFRVTFFPGSTDHSLVVSLIVIFFDGVKLWI